MKSCCSVRVSDTGTAPEKRGALKAEATGATEAQRARKHTADPRGVPATAVQLISQTRRDRSKLRSDRNRRLGATPSGLRSKGR